MKLNTTVAPFILRGVSPARRRQRRTAPMALRQTIWNKLAVEWRPDRVHDQVRTIDFDELPDAFRPVPQGHGPRAHRRADRRRLRIRGLTRSNRVRRSAHRSGVTANEEEQRLADVPRVPPPLARRPRGVLARAGGADRLADAVRGGPRLLAAAVRAAGSSAGATNLCHNARRPPSRRARRPDGAGLHLDRDRRDATLHVPRAPRRSEPLRRDAASRSAWGAAIAC